MIPVGVQREELVEAMRTNLDLFASVCLPDVYKFKFPPLYQAVWQLLTSGALKELGQEKIALGLPRGFAKTLLLKLFKVWLVLYSTRRFSIVVCNTATLAENFLSDVCSVLSSDNIKSLFGSWKLTAEIDRQDLKKFHFRGRPITLAALGSGTSLRGLNIQYQRPDIMILDDMQSREEAESQVESEKQLVWLLATLLKANDKTRCQFIFVGNMYPYQGSILKKLKHHPGWTSFITGAILEDGCSLWPQLRPLEDILDELENDTQMGHPEIFFSEVMNDEEAGNRTGVDITQIKTFDPQEEPQAGFILIDPSAGKKKSDDVAIGVFLLYDGKPMLAELTVGKLDPKQTIVEAFKLLMKYQLMAIVVEAVAYQATLGFWLEEAKKRHGLTGCRILEVYPAAKGSKNTGIITALKQLTAAEPSLRISAKVRSQVVHQIIHFNPLKTNNKDDILDLLAYAYPVVQQFGALLLKPWAAAPSVEASFSDSLELSF